MKIITDIFEQELHDNVMSTLFPNLNSNDFNILFSYLLNIIDIIAIKFHINSPIFEEQFRQNNYRDATSVLLMLLPYINDDTKSITSFDDLVKKK